MKLRSMGYSKKISHPSLPLRGREGQRDGYRGLQGDVVYLR
jgi:hypothetical protein